MRCPSPLPRILTVLLVVVFGMHPAFGVGGFEAALKSRISGGSSEEPLTIGTQRIYWIPVIQRLYQETGFRHLWNRASIQALSRSIDQLRQEGLTPRDYRFPEIESQLGSPAPERLPPAARVELEILLCEVYLRAFSNLRLGKVDPPLVDPEIHLRRPFSLERFLPSLITAFASGDPLDHLYPMRRADSDYTRLKAGLARYRALQAAGGWDPIPPGPVLKIGDSDPRVIQVRRRLEITGDLAADLIIGAGGDLYDLALAEAVMRNKGTASAPGEAGAKLGGESPPGGKG